MNRRPFLLCLEHYPELPHTKDRQSQKSLEDRTKASVFAAETARRRVHGVRPCHLQRNTVTPPIGMRERGMIPLGCATHWILHGLQKREWNGCGFQRDTGPSGKYETIHL